MSKNVKVNGVSYTGVSQVQLPTTGGGTALFKDVDEITTPSGSVTITENGTHNVANYAQAVVNVESNSGDAEDNYNLIKALMNGLGTLSEDVYLKVPPGIKTVRGFSRITTDSGNFRVYVSLPDSIETIEADCFSYSTLTVIGELPPNLKTICANAFRKARNIFGSSTELIIPATVEELKAEAFYQYDGPAKTLTFKGTPTTMASNCLQGAGITVINVPWAEGAVANAPWAATGATINYNYTGA
jgi:hypothetical protein